MPKVGLSSDPIDTHDFYRLIEDREYGTISDEQFAAKLINIGCPTHVLKWLVDVFRKPNV
jgi:hypothetical protein